MQHTCLATAVWTFSCIRMLLKAPFCPRPGRIKKKPLTSRRLNRRSDGFNQDRITFSTDIIRPHSSALRPAHQVTSGTQKNITWQRKPSPALQEHIVLPPRHLRLTLHSYISPDRNRNRLGLKMFATYLDQVVRRRWCRGGAMF